MSYILKENNAFYGSKGNKISNQLYNRLPTHHQLLFEKYDSNNNDFDGLINELKASANRFNDVMPKHVKFNVNENIDLGNAFYEGLVMDNQTDEFIGALEEDDDNEYDPF